MTAVHIEKLPMSQLLVDQFRRVVQEELDRLVKTTLPGIVQTEIKFALARDSANLQRCIQRAVTVQASEFVKRELSATAAFPDKLALLEFALRHVRIEGQFLEFGVYSGHTINFIAERAPAGTVVTGFDSFEGLPETWRAGYPKGAYKISRLPKVRRNVRLVKGLFSNTLPAFASQHKQPIAFLHCDCDLYSSTVTVFQQLGSRIRSGSVIVFDEFFNYPDWEQGEYKAFLEFVKDRKASFEYLGYTHGRDSEQVGVRITKIKNSTK